MALGRSSDKGMGLWDLVSQRPIEDERATARQEVASRYLIDDMPDDAVLGFEAARELLSVRSYVIGMLTVMYRHKANVHPREVMWWILREAYLNPSILKAIRKWNRDRYFEDRGPARVGATRFFEPLRDFAIRKANLSAPTEDQSIAIRDAELRRHGLDKIVTQKAATIDYVNVGELTTRYISNIEVFSRWPWWSFWLINPPSFISIEAFCHLRNQHRSFAAHKITRTA